MTFNHPDANAQPKGESGILGVDAARPCSASQDANSPVKNISTPNSSISTTEHKTNVEKLHHETGCERCRVLEEELAQASDSVGALSFKLHQSALAEHALRRQIKRLREDHPEVKQVRATLEHWKTAMRKKGSTKIPIDGKRADMVRRARNWGFRFDEIRLAIDGAARFPYVVDYRRAASGPKSARFDDLDTILKSERQIEMLMGLGSAP